MNKKIIIQFILFFIIFSFIALFVFEYLIKPKLAVSDTQKQILSLNLDDNLTNVIENIEYSSNDSLNNQFIIKAKFGEVMRKKTLILMKEVEAIVIFSNSEKITITASNAIYNTTNQDTNFKENVIIKYGEQNITCNRVDMQFRNYKVKLYDNVIYNYINTKLLADVIEIDLLKKSSKIYMNKKNTKVEAMYKNNVSN
jgi:lipopolysaccharide assembly outer membrane protein LptD (OstA)